MSRDKNIKFIKNNISDTSDKTVTTIYKKISDICNDIPQEEKKIKRAQKIKYTSSNLGMVEEEDLLSIIKIINDELSYKKRYDKLLDILNNILEHLGEEQIETITDFKGITRDVLATDECNQIVLNKKQEIIDCGFDKNINGLHSYKKIKYGHINVIKGLCEQLNYSFSAVKIRKKIQNKTINTTQYFIKEK